MKYLIIGNSAAGIGGIEGIRSRDSKGEITVVTDESYHVYSRPLISYYLAKKVDFEQMKYRSDEYYQKNDVQLFMNKKAVNLNSRKQQVILEDGKQLDYDKLLLATGGQPFIPPIKGKDKENIFTFIKLDEVKKIKNNIKSNDSGKVIILGGGLIGLKAAEAFIKHGLEVIVVELAERILSTILDRKAASLVKDYLQQKGIKFHLADTVVEFKGNEKVEKVKLQSGLTIDCDLAVIATGVKPNLSLVKKQDIDYNQGIIVDKYLKTSGENIFAAGDVCEGYNMLSGTVGVIPIWPNAYNQGYTAGKNMTGDSKKYEENFAQNSIGFFDLSMITAGIINPEFDENVLDEDKRYQIYDDKKSDEYLYKKFIIKDNKLVGYILVNNVDRAGILTGLIKDQKNIADVKEKLLNENFGLLSVNKKWRQEKILN